MRQVKEIPAADDHYLDDQLLNRPNSAEKSGKEIYLHSSSTRIFREEIKNPSLMTSSSSSTAQKNCTTKKTERMGRSENFRVVSLNHFSPSDRVDQVRCELWSSSSPDALLRASCGTESESE